MSSHRSLWRHYPPVQVVVYERIRPDAPECVVVQVDEDRFECTSRCAEVVSSLLFILRHVTVLQLVCRDYGAVDPGGPSVGVTSGPSVTAAASLRHCSQLHSLRMRTANRAAADQLAASLTSLPSLTSLELTTIRSHSIVLATVIRHLCSSQLVHLAVSSAQLGDTSAFQPASRCLVSAR